MYFKKFPDILYEFPFNSGNQLLRVKDITRNVRPFQDVLNNVVYYDDYDIQDGDTPEIISERIYGTPLLHWVIMLVNEKYHYLNDFPIPETRFDDFMINKYGSIEVAYHQHILYGKPHFVSSTGRVVDSDYPGAIPVTNYEYERGLNEAKRRIRVVNASLIDTFVNDLNRVIAK